MAPSRRLVSSELPDFCSLNHSQKIITKCDGIIKNCDNLVYYKVRWTVITNCDSFFITKCDTVYYKLRQVLQSAMDLLQIAKGITKCDDYYKLRQYRLLFLCLPCSGRPYTFLVAKNVVCRTTKRLKYFQGTQRINKHMVRTNRITRQGSRDP